MPKCALKMMILGLKEACVNAPTVIISVNPHTGSDAPVLFIVGNKGNWIVCKLLKDCC